MNLRILLDRLLINSNGALVHFDKARKASIADFISATESYLNVRGRRKP